MAVDDRDPLDPFDHSLAETGRCCLARHAQAVPPWTCDCPCHHQPEREEETPAPEVDYSQLSDGDLGLAPDTRALSPEQILRLGALTLIEEQSEAVERLITDQEETYRQILRQQGPGPLIQALVARDRLLAYTGRQFADGRTAGHLLREFMRVALQRSDHAALRAIGDATKAGQIEGLLEALGGEPADARQLKLHGSTLGPLEDLAARQAALKSGERKE